MLNKTRGGVMNKQSDIRLVENIDDYYGFVNEIADIRNRGIDLEDRLDAEEDEAMRQHLYSQVVMLYEYYLELKKLRRVK